MTVKRSASDSNYSHFASDSIYCNARGCITTTMNGGSARSTGVVAGYLIIFLVQCFRCRAMDEANACTKLINLALAWQTGKYEIDGDNFAPGNRSCCLRARKRRQTIDNNHDSGRSEQITGQSMAFTCADFVHQHTASCHAALAALSQSHFRRRASTRTNQGQDTLLHSAH